jgi:chitinase
VKLTLGRIATYCLAAQLLSAHDSGKEVIAYVFAQDRAIEAGEIDAGKLTRINYAFGNLLDGALVEGFAHDAGNFAVLNSLKRSNPRLRVLVSVGGWTWSGGFSDMALTEASRRKFIDSAAAFVEKYALDGVDIDWEYPGLPGMGNRFRPEDGENYTALLRELRRRFDGEEKRLGRRLFTSVATGASTSFLEHTAMSNVARYVDTVNLMSYDYYEPTDDRVTGHHAPLHTNPADPKAISAEASVKAYLAAGVPKNKLVLGVPFYGHAWSDVGGAANGLYQPGKAAHVDANYRSIPALLAAGYVRYWDPVSSAPFLYNSATRTFVSYEDTESVKLKAEYVVREKLRGVMFWEYHGDDRGALLGAIWTGLGLK